MIASSLGRSFEQTIECCVKFFPPPAPWEKPHDHAPCSVETFEINKQVSDFSSLTVLSTFIL